MPIIEPVIRPPAEADSFLLQLTLGCSSDSCTFCGAYKNKPFTVKPFEEVAADIERHARWDKETRRVFLMDGDAMVLSNAKLLSVLDKLHSTFPRLTRVASYANGTNIIQKSEQELKELAEKKLTLIYMGLESGDQSVLDRCGKKSSVDQMVLAVQKAARVGIKSSVIVLLGLGGKEHSTEHVRGTIEALNRMQPRHLSFLSLMVIPGTPLAKKVKRKVFQELTRPELLQESRAIIEGLELQKTIFRSNHASNHLALEGTFPKDKSVLLAELKSAIDGEVHLRPEYLRAL